MKNSTKFGLALASVIGLAAAIVCFADIPNYKSFSGTEGTTSSEVIIPADPTLSLRVVGVVAQSDKATSLLKFSAGTTAVGITYSNAAGTAITVDRTNSLNANDIIIISSASLATNVSATISSISNTNLTLSATDGIAVVPGDQVYKLGTVTSWKVGATTNYSAAGEALFTAPKGRPIRVLLDGTSDCALNSVTARYE